MRRKTEIAAGKSTPPDLRRRLIVALLIPLIIILCVSSLLGYRLAGAISDATHDQALADEVSDLESHIEGIPAAFRLEMSEELQSSLRAHAPDQVYYSIRDNSGRTLYGDDDIPYFPIPKSNQVSFIDAAYHGANVRVALLRAITPATEVFITIMETTVNRELSRHKILTAMLLTNLAVILATLLTVLFGIRQGLLPLEAVEKEIASRSPHDLHEIDLDTAPREIHPMLRRLNQLFSLLREASAAQNRFIADAAHQLRTPLAGLQTQLDLAVTEGAFSRNEVRLQNIELGTAHLERLLGQLLSYARAETSASITKKMERVSLDQIVEKSASAFFDAALRKNIDLGFEISPVSINGIPWLLQEALANLIDNAIRYTPRDGIITVRCGETNGKAFLEVEDNGPGIAQEHLSHVFERFYRIPGSPSNGCGLGLPIVKEIAELHGAEVLLNHKESNGFCVRLEFSSPLALPDVARSA
jgi:two-component system sensor histidine kinase TctE